jgi:hypothetical protein
MVARRLSKQVVLDRGISEVELIRMAIESALVEAIGSNLECAKAFHAATLAALGHPLHI